MKGEYTLPANVEWDQKRDTYTFTIELEGDQYRRMVDDGIRLVHSMLVKLKRNPENNSLYIEACWGEDCE